MRWRRVRKWPVVDGRKCCVWLSQLSWPSLTSWLSWLPSSIHGLPLQLFQFSCLLENSETKAVRAQPVRPAFGLDWKDKFQPGQFCLLLTRHPSIALTHSSSHAHRTHRYADKRAKTGQEKGVRRRGGVRRRIKTKELRAGICKS